MAEYRETSMVHAALRRSLLSPHWGKQPFPPTYTLGKNHVRYFFNKRKFIRDRWWALISELERRDFAIDYASRRVDFRIFRYVQCVQWQPTPSDIAISRDRIVQRFLQKPHWYKYYGRPVTVSAYLKLLYQTGE